MKTALLLVAIVQIVQAVEPAPLPRVVKNAKTLLVVNQGIENYIYDHVYDRLRRWPRFALVEERTEADLVVILTAENHFYGLVPLGSTSSTNATATTGGNVTAVNSTTTTTPLMFPLASNRKHLIVLDAKTGEHVLAVETAEGFLLSRTAKALVDRLKGRFPKAER
jgi:hypothetical protein